MRERKAVFHMQSNPSAIQKLLKRGLQAGTKQINIIGIEMDGIGHTMAAVTAAIAFFTVDFCHVGGSVPAVPGAVCVHLPVFLSHL